MDDFVPSMDVGVAWRRGDELSLQTRAFKDFLSLTFHGGTAGHSYAGPIQAGAQQA